MPKTVSIFSMLLLAAPLCAEPAYSWLSMSDFTMKGLNALTASSLDRVRKTPAGTNSKKYDSQESRDEVSQLLMEEDEDEVNAAASDSIPHATSPVPMSVAVAVPTAPPVAAPAPAPYMPPMR